MDLKDVADGGLLPDEASITMLQAESPSPMPHLAIDIGGSLIKLVYYSRNGDWLPEDNKIWSSKESLGVSNGESNHPLSEGRLHFAKFETSKINDCIEFIQSKQLHVGGRHPEVPSKNKIIIKATGGGAFKFTDLFKEKLGILLDKKDEMDCLVAGANFLLKIEVVPFHLLPLQVLNSVMNRGEDERPVLPHSAVQREAFIYMDGEKEFVQIDHKDLYPYLLVNIGSGVSMIKVDGDGKFERVSGTSVGGGTFWGLGRLLTQCQSFDELLELSRVGNNRVIDMLVGDIYGTDYTKIGLSSTNIASSFGKAISVDKELEDYKPEDISRSLLRMISNNIGQIAYLNALRYGLKRIFFGGFFIRGHAYTMDTISVAVHYWSKGEAQAMFLQHEGFLGALGAFTSYERHGFDDLMVHQLTQLCPRRESCLPGRYTTQGPTLGCE